MPSSRKLIIVPETDKPQPNTQTKRRKLQIVIEPKTGGLTDKPPPPPPSTPAPVTKKVKPPRRVFTVELAKSGRGRCAGCKQLIEKGAPRLGVITFYPHRSARWHHCNVDCLGPLVLSMTSGNLKGFNELEKGTQASVEEALVKPFVKPVKELTSITGVLSVGQMAKTMTGRYNRFRKFRFGLQESEMYTSSWNWRCFLATILVCNSKEVHMLKVTDKLFRDYPDQKALLSLRGQKDKQKALKDSMEKDKLRHVGRKLFSIINATAYLEEHHDGKVPKSRSELMTLPGVGTHVSSVTMAWVHEEPEFGVDVHVRRILERWGYVEERDPEDVIEAKIKAQVPADQIGHFSRSFVDHGQSVCGYTPDCGSCYLNKACPSASKYMDW